MFNYHFKTYGETTEKDVYILADNYENALNRLFEIGKFYTYQFLGLVD